MRPARHVVLACNDCAEQFGSVSSLAEHTESEHGRSPTRRERTPVR